VGACDRQSVETLAAELDATPPERAEKSSASMTRRWKLVLTIAFLRGYGSA
jgi:hypothetical protein